MFKPTSVLEGQTIPSPEEDFRSAQRVEQYRLSDRALYIPAGLRWTYLPLDAVESAEESHRVIVAGKCVAVEEKRPCAVLRAGGRCFTVHFEKAESLRKLLAAIPKER